MTRLPSLLLRSRVNNPFESWFGNVDDVVNSMFRGWTPSSSSGFNATFPIDVKETDKEYEIKANLPGINKEDIHLTLENSVLTIELKQEGEKEKSEDNFVVRERFSNYSSRAISLPFTTSESKVSAALKDGVLSIAIPKMPEKQTKRIAVN